MDSCDSHERSKCMDKKMQKEAAMAEAKLSVLSALL